MQAHTYHEATKHSYWSVRSSSHHLDWSMQPSPFKIYPDNYPLIPMDLENPLFRFLYRIGGIDAKKSYPGVTYYLRTVPSAGALYPTELYLQARGVEGLYDGIYHFSVAQNALRLLYKIGSDEGVECYFDDKRQIKGFVFLLSSIYYRSSWKYRTRAFRYCLLDSGHMLGALEVSSYLWDHAYHIHYNFDKAALNETFGFAKREFFLSSAIVGVPTKQVATKLAMQLPFVDGTGFFQVDLAIEQAYQESVKLIGCKASFRYPRLSFVKERLEEAVWQRRSARNFCDEPIKKEFFQAIVKYMQSSIPSDCDEEVHIWCVVNRVEGMEPGLYKQTKLIKKGDFSKKASYLCLEQEFVADGAVVFFLTSNASNYQSLYQKAGHIGHRAYIASTYFGLGCSGLGAYYDDEVADFLETSDMVLYALVIGKER